MAEALKDIFNPLFFDRFTNDLNQVVQGFDKAAFISQIFDCSWENRAYKQRIIHITRVLRNFLPQEYPASLAIIYRLLDHIKDKAIDFSVIDDKNFQLLNVEYGSILDCYVGMFGLNDFENSIIAIEKITQYTTCEFCVRPFIIQYPDEMMKQMLAWSTHKHWGVRRLASEGCRPRLPWGMALPNLKENPSPIIPILENLKNDPSRFVRLSVANNLNDIAKDNPEAVITLAKKWHGKSQEVDWIVKHGCRTLLKQGNVQVMELFSFEVLGDAIVLDNFQITTPQVRIGDFLEFSFNLLNTRNKAAKIRLEYGLYYQKANGTLSKKVHKISEKLYAANSTTKISRKHSFRVVTTRKLHVGLHQVSVIINGNEYERHNFELIV